MWGIAFVINNYDSIWIWGVILLIAWWLILHLIVKIHTGSSISHFRTSVFKGLQLIEYIHFNAKDCFFLSSLIIIALQLNYFEYPDWLNSHHSHLSFSNENTNTYILGIWFSVTRNTFSVWWLMLFHIWIIK